MISQSSESKTIGKLIRLPKPKPQVMYYHYSNSASQGALICQTRGFQGEYDDAKFQWAAVYSDRLCQRDSARYDKTCKIAGGGDQLWGSLLPLLNDKKLREFAKEALNLSVLPRHVRVVHHFDVSNGNSYPNIEATYEKIYDRKQGQNRISEDESPSPRV
jgi:hypothetical protein